MPKTKRKINIMQGKRLKKLLAEEGITQKQLSEEIHTSQQYISEIINGKAHLSYSIADSTSKMPRFKNYNLLKEWLLCEENFKSSHDKLLNASIASRYKNNLLLTSLECLLNLSNYDVTTQETLSENGVFDLSFMTIRKDNQLIAELSKDDIEKLGFKLLRLFEVYIKDYFA